jgi:hypothetical protein
MLPKDSAHFIIPASRPDDVPYRPDAQLSKASSVWTTWTFRPDLPLCQEASKLLQLASVRTFQQDVRTTLSVRQASGFSSKTQLWEDRCNLPNDVDSRPDALIHKASIAFKIQTSDLQSAWSERASIIYGNCVHQINRPDDHSFGFGRAKSWYGNYLQRQYDRPDDRTPPSGRGSKQGRISVKFLKSRLHSCLSGCPITTVRTAPRFYQARHSFETSAYK